MKSDISTADACSAQCHEMHVLGSNALGRWGCREKIPGTESDRSTALSYWGDFDQCVHDPFEDLVDNGWIWRKKRQGSSTFAARCANLYRRVVVQRSIIGRGLSILRKIENVREKVSLWAMSAHLGITGVEYINILLLTLF